MKSLEELRAIQARMQYQMGIRNDKNEDGKIVVGLGTCGIAAGARDVVHAFTENLGKNNVFRVAVIQDGNLDCAECAPMAVVHLGDEKEVTYVNLTPEKVARIVNEHILGGKVVTEYTASAGK